MALSPREEQALATLEAALRADDPALARALGAGTPAPPIPQLRVTSVLAARHLVHLLTALSVLIVVAAVWGGELGAVGTAAATAVLLLPWLVLTARATGVRRQRPPTGAQPVGALSAGLAVVAGLLLVGLMLPAVWAPVFGLVVVLVGAPWLALKVLNWIDRSTPDHPSRSIL